MGRQTQFTYRLPCAVAVVSGTVRRVTDLDVGTALGDTRAELLNKTVEIRHQADDAFVVTGTVKGGWFFQYKASFAMKEDGRLTKASSEATGAGAEVISAGATLTGFAMAAAPVVFDPSAQELEMKRKAAYLADHEDVAKERTSLAKRRDDLRTKIGVLEDALIADSGSAMALRPQLQALRETERLMSERIATLDVHYSVWLAGRRTTIDEEFEFVIPLAELRETLEDVTTAHGVALSDKESKGIPSTAGDLWRRYGLAVLLAWTRTRTRQPQAPVASAASTKVLAREAEPVVIKVVEHQNERPVITSTSRHLVADATSPQHEYELKRTFFGRRSLAISFSDNGYLSGLDAEGAAVLGEAAKSLSGAPAALGSGVDSFNKLSSGLTTARQAGLTSELARVKAEVELRQQRLVAAGLDVTTGDATRLARLTQLKDILEAQTAIKGTDPALVAALKEAAGHDLDWYTAPEQP